MSFDSKSVWKSERLVYRGLVFPQDDGFLMEHISDSHSQAMAFAGMNRPPTSGALEAVKKHYTDLSLLAAVICIPKEDAEPPQVPRGIPKTVDDWHAKQRAQYTEIGIISLQKGNPLFDHHRETGIGIVIWDGYRGQGYGPEAINWITDFAFLNANVHRVNIGSFSYNWAWKLYERLGFTVEGRKRECLWYNGEYHDMVQLGMLENEWRELRGKKKAQ